MFRKLFCLIVFFGLIFPARVMADKTSDVKKMLELSGTRQQVAQLSDIVDSVLSMQGGRVSSKDDAKFRKIVKDAYGLDEVYNIIESMLMQKYDQKYVSDTLKWLDTPISKRFTQLEVEATTPEGVKAMFEYSSELKKNPPPEKRMALMERLDKASGSSRLSADLTVYTFGGITRAINNLFPSNKRMSERQIQNMADKMKADTLSSVKQGTMQSLLYVYRAASDDEITQYLGYLESDTGQWFYKIVSEGFVKALTGIADDVSKKVTKEFPKPAGDVTSEEVALKAAAMMSELLKSDDWIVRRDMANALGEIGDMADIQLLRKLLNDKHEMVRSAASASIQRIRSRFKK